MTYVPPQPVDLSAEEADLWALVRPSLDDGAHPHRNWAPIADAMDALVVSLMEREAIPEIRLALFTDPTLAEKGSRSPQQVFESNGTSGAAIRQHPNFVRFLRFFVEGPDLPESAVLGLCKILNEDRGTSGMLMKQYQAHARRCVRQFGLSKHHAATEFYRLGMEIGMDQFDAGTLRQAAMTTR